MRKPRLAREQIRAIHGAPLATLLRQRGFQLLELPAGNFQLATYQGLLVKDSYSRWPQRQLAGTTIDLFVRVLGLSCHDTMRLIAEP